MISPKVREEILQQLDQLPPSRQQDVLKYARRLTGAALQGRAGADLLCFSGSFSEKDADAMERVVQAECEQVGVWQKPNIG